MPCGFVEIR